MGRTVEAAVRRDAVISIRTSIAGKRHFYVWCWRRRIDMSDVGRAAINAPASRLAGADAAMNEWLLWFVNGESNHPLHASDNAVDIIRATIAGLSPVVGRTL